MTVKAIPLTLSEMEIIIAVQNLERGMLAIIGGEDVGKWVKAHKRDVVHIFANLDECVIQLRDGKATQAFLEFMGKKRFNGTQSLADYVKQIKPKDQDEPLLIFRWD